MQVGAKQQVLIDGVPFDGWVYHRQWTDHSTGRYTFDINATSDEIWVPGLEVVANMHVVEVITHPTGGPQTRDQNVTMRGYRAGS